MTPRLMSRALQLAEQGWYVFPLGPGGKRPVPRFTKWEARATTDRAQIVQWWRAAPYNIGIATGPSELLVIDCDKPRGADLAEWREQGRNVEIAGRLLPSTFTVRTPSGGLHLYFSAPNQALGNTVGKVGSHIDTRGCGGYVVGPGSICSGKYYRIIDRSPLAHLPEWIIEALGPADYAEPAPASVQRHQDRYVRAILEGEAERVRTAAPGSRNSALNIASFLLGQLVGHGRITEHDVWDTLRTAARKHIGIQGFTESEMDRTIRSGLTAGVRKGPG